jgi:serine/threonine-protein kinase SRPK3
LSSDLKPENVLLWIDDVEAVVEIELAKSGSAPHIVGAPPSKGRGGNQTPRNNSVNIMGSQPLPSPSSSSSSIHDKWGFGMSSISSTNSPPAATSNSTDVIVQVMESVRLDSPIGKKTTQVQKPAPGPSLLSQQAPTNKGLDTTVAARATFNTGTSTPEQQVDEDLEHLRVIIADFGNGEWIMAYLVINSVDNLPGTWTHHHFTGKTLVDLTLDISDASKTTSRHGSTGRPR